jgi:outer membrane receptor protein involved in Fe transport
MIINTSFHRNYSLIFLFACLLCNSNTLFAQQTAISLKAINKKGEAISGASIIVSNSIDSLQVVKTVADTNGIVKLHLATGNQFLVQISAVNYKYLQKGISINGKQNNFVFTLEPNTKNLDEVVITNKKPLMRQEEDKTIVDPENIASTSTNAFEMMEKIPGLFVDQDGNIYISSTTPATILINGRDTRMSTADVATMLKSLPPGTIAKLEIIRTPSAKYDASGGGGVVNVVLKKGVKIGLTGSVNAGANQGVYGNQFVGFNLNNNNGKLNTYISAQFNLRNTYEQIKTDRKFASDTILSQNAYTRYPGSSTYLGYGIGYEINKNWEINYDGRFTINNNKNNSINQSDIQKISIAKLLTNNFATIDNKAASVGFNQSITAKYKIDSAGSEWVTDLSYNYNTNKTDQQFATSFSYPVNAIVYGDGNFNNQRNFFVAQSDVKFKLKKQFTLEAGVKASFISFTSAADFFKSTNGNRAKDNERTNSFTYSENINAAYLQGTKTIKKFVIKAGARLENTNMDGRQIVPVDTSFALHRTDVFPYVYLSRDLFKIASYPLKGYLVYRRTISRPGYDLLNPFSRFVDQYLSETGNPALRPQFTNNYEANVSFEERPVFAIGYNDTKDIFTNVIYQSDSNRSKAIRTYDNLGSNKETYFRMIAAVPPGGKYFIVVGAQYNHNFYNGIYENAPLAFKRGSWSFFSYQTLKLGKLSMASINGFVRFNGQQQFYELGTFGSLNASINRQFFNKKMIVTLNVTDLFFTNNNTFSIKQGTINASGFKQADTRRVGINIRYNFGFRKKDENNMMNQESPEKSN